jgi:hypothetical protein
LRFALKHLPPQQWLDEFLAAERVDAYWNTPPRQAAYWQALLDAPELLREYWQADSQQVEDVQAALRELIEGNLPLFAQIAPVVEPFTEFSFHSTMPVLGSLLSKLRQFWYNVAARWGVRHLQQQQDAVNHLILQETQQQARLLRRQTHLLQRQTHLLQHQVDELALGNAALTQQLALLKSEQHAAPAGYESRKAANSGDEILGVVGE